VRGRRVLVAAPSVVGKFRKQSALLGTLLVLMLSGVVVWSAFPFSPSSVSVSVKVCQKVMAGRFVKSILWNVEMISAKPGRTP
jgi:hypothetical protein